MTTRTIQTGDKTITITDDSPPPMPGAAEAITGHEPRMITIRKHEGFDMGSFVAGLFVAAMIAVCLAIRRGSLVKRRERDDAAIGIPADRMAAEVAALARRTATLETIVTDPGQRTAREIEALR